MLVLKIRLYTQTFNVQYAEVSGKMYNKIMWISVGVEEEFAVSICGVGELSRSE
jgi:hypothetical protein